MFLDKNLFYPGFCLFSVWYVLHQNASFEDMNIDDTLPLPNTHTYT